MKPSIVRAPIAVTVDGELLLNLTALDVAANPHALAEALQRTDDAVFVGVRLSAKEARTLLRDLALVLPNVTDRVAVHRLRRR